MTTKQLIDTESAFQDFVEACEASPYMAIDTEFLREKTYYPKTCLVQIGIEGMIAIIDPLALASLKPLARPFTNPDILKIFHACSQDMEILLRETAYCLLRYSIRRSQQRCLARISSRRMLF